MHPGVRFAKPLLRLGAMLFKRTAFAAKNYHTKPAALPLESAPLRNFKVAADAAVSLATYERQ
jgi:hypothetical protein